MGVLRFHCGEILARRRFSAGAVSMLPTVGVLSSMNEITPCNMEATDHAGTCRGKACPQGVRGAVAQMRRRQQRAARTQVSGWKSLIERQRRVLVLNRPL